ncbi:MAG: hypothetical protein LBU60_01655 [Clostridiales bacterium]|jgi:hypothetical protein|nr:hypothetical protein [Clostridiales bacterium]
MFEKIEIELIIKALGSYGKDIAQKMVNSNNLLIELQKQAKEAGTPVTAQATTDQLGNPIVSQSIESEQAEQVAYA